MQVVLVMFRPDGQRRSFSVVRDMTVIGRREDCDLRIPLGDVSRKHCRLIKDGDAIRVEDLGSSNGTYRNGQRIQQSEFAAGDTLQVGPIVFVLQIDGVPEDEELQPVTSAAGAVGAPAATGEAEDELTVVEEEGGDDENAPFDPMEALSAAEGSGFEFAIEEEMAAAAAAQTGEEDVQVDLSEGEAAVEAAAEAPAELEDAPAEQEEAEVVLDDEAPAESDEAPVDLDGARAELEEAAEDLEEAPVDLEESEHDQKA
ncbi:MAG: FHA domain-containing protein [Tepidisphaeraceae bacterium]